MAFHFDDSKAPSLRWILVRASRYRLLMVGGLAAMVVANALSSSSLFFVGIAIDHARNGAMREMAFFAFGALLARVVNGLVSLVSTYANVLLAMKTERDVRSQVMLALFATPDASYGQTPLADRVASVTNDPAHIGGVVTPGARMMINAILRGLAALTAIALLSPSLLLAPLLFLMGSVISVRGVSRRLRPVARRQRSQFGKLATHVLERLTNVELVQTYHAQHYESERFREEVQVYRDTFVQQGRVDALSLPLLVFVGTFAAAFAHAALLMNTGTVTPGAMTAYLLLFSQLLNVAEFNSRSLPVIHRALASVDSVKRFLATPSAAPVNQIPESRRISHGITFEHVTFARDRQLAIHNCSFEVKVGEVVAVIGPPGSGKSTIARLLAGRYQATSGRVLVDGTDIRQWPTATLTRDICLVDSDTFLFSKSVQWNITMGAAHRFPLEAVQKAARQASAHDFVMRLPNEYKTVLSELGRDLSGGERQRLGLARAFLWDPIVLILDDATSALDRSTDSAIHSGIASIRKDRAIVFVTNRRSDLLSADRIVVLRNGLLAAEGSHDILYRTSDLYRDLFQWPMMPS